MSFENDSDRQPDSEIEPTKPLENDWEFGRIHFEGMRDLAFNMREFSKRQIKSMKRARPAHAYRLPRFKKQLISLREAIARIDETLRDARLLINSQHTDSITDQVFTLFEAFFENAFLSNPNFVDRATAVKLRRELNEIKRRLAQLPPPSET